MSEEKPKIKFTARYIGNRVYLKPACDKSTALIGLLSQKGPRATLETNELALIGKMGFDIEVGGDMKEFRQEMDRMIKK